MKRFIRKFQILMSAKKLAWRVMVQAVRRFPVFNSKLFRRLIFDTSKSNTLLLSVGDTETFVISSADKYIGRDTYISGNPYDFELMQKALKILGNRRPNQLLIDVGANIGTICIPAVKRSVFQNAIAIEPDPFNYSLLLANIHINRLDQRIVAHNLALGKDNDERLFLKLSRDNFGDHRVRANNHSIEYDDESHRKTVVVKSETFDKIVDNIDPKRSLIWIDTQGSEGQVLFGAKNALRHLPPMCFELWPNGMERMNGYPLLKETLIRVGYTVFYDLDGSEVPEAAAITALDYLYEKMRARGMHTNVLVF